MTLKTAFDHRPDCELLTVPTHGLCTCDFDRRAENRERRKEAWKSMEAAERIAFVKWLEQLDPPIPTTREVEQAWRAWQARADLLSGAVAAGEITL